MRIFKIKRVPETIALVLSIAVFLLAWAQVIAQEYKQDNSPEIDKNQNYVEGKKAPSVEAVEEKEKAEVKAVAEEKVEMEVAVTGEEYDLLARAVYSEARGEPFQGQVAIAAVILNRVEHENFPDTINDVIFQPSAFTAVQDGQFWLTPDSTAKR